MKPEKSKIKQVIEGANDLSLGVSMVVAVVLGFAIGYGMKKLFGYDWLLWLGVFWGVAAAGLNIYKAYQKLNREMKELENNPRYKNRKPIKDDEDED